MGLIDRISALFAKNPQHKSELPARRPGLHSIVATSQASLPPGAALVIAYDPTELNANKDGNTPLHLATLYNNVAMVQFLLKEGADVNAKDADGNTSLHLAARMILGLGEAAAADTIVVIMQLLLDKGADINAKNNNGDTPLISAGFGGEVNRTRLLLGRGAQVNATGCKGWTALHHAARDYAEAVKLCLEKGADVNARASVKFGDVSADGWTPLHIAAHEGRATSVRLLLDKGADVNAKDSKGNTPLAYAKNNPEVRKLLHEHGAR